MFRIVENGGGVARVVTRGPETIRGPANIYCLFFFVFTFTQERFLARGGGHSQLRLYTRDKQLFHLKIVLIIYRRAFSRGGSRPMQPMQMHQSFSHDR